MLLIISILPVICAFVGRNKSLLGAKDALISGLVNYGTVANARFLVKPAVPTAENRHCHDYRSKIWAVLHISKNDPSSGLLTVVRLDNVMEPISEQALREYENLWKECAGWPIELRLSFTDGQRTIDYLVPANPRTDFYQLRVRNVFRTPVPMVMEIPRNLFSVRGNHADKDTRPLILKSLVLKSIMHPNYRHFVTTVDQFALIMKRTLFHRHNGSLSVEKVFGYPRVGDLARSKDLLDDPEEVLGWKDPIIDALDGMQPLAFKTDIYRYFVLYHFGGAYFDGKCVSLTPLDSWLPPRGSALCEETPGTAGFLNGLIASTCGEPLLGRALGSLVENHQSRYYGSRDLEISGPMFLHRVYEDKLTPGERSSILVPLRHVPHAYLMVFKSNPEYAACTTCSNEYRRAFKGNERCSYAHLWNNRCVYYERLCDHRQGIIGD